MDGCSWVSAHRCGGDWRSGHSYLTHSRSTCLISCFACIVRQSYQAIRRRWACLSFRAVHTQRMNGAHWYFVDLVFSRAFLCLTVFTAACETNQIVIYFNNFLKSTNWFVTANRLGNKLDLWFGGEQNRTKGKLIRRIWLGFLWILLRAFDSLEWNRKENCVQSVDVNDKILSSRRWLNSDKVHIESDPKGHRSENTVYPNRE